MRVKEEERKLERAKMRRLSCATNIQLKSIRNEDVRIGGEIIRNWSGSQSSLFM